MNVQRTARLSMANIAPPKPQRVHYSNISDLKSQLSNINNISASLRPEKLSELKQTATDFIKNIPLRQTKATSDKMQKVEKLLKKITNLIDKEVKNETMGRFAFNSGRTAQDNANKTADANNSYNKDTSRGLGLSKEFKSNRMDCN